jgi:hypothetical protein
MPGLPLLLAAVLLIVAIAVGMGVATAESDAPAQVVTTSHTAYGYGPSVRFGAIGWEVTPAGPHGVHQQPKEGGATETSQATETEQGFGSTIGKRLP